MSGYDEKVSRNVNYRTNNSASNNQESPENVKFPKSAASHSTADIPGLSFSDYNDWSSEYGTKLPPKLELSCSVEEFLKIQKNREGNHPPSWSTIELNSYLTDVDATQIPRMNYSDNVFNFEEAKKLSHETVQSENLREECPKFIQTMNNTSGQCTSKKIDDRNKYIEVNCPQQKINFDKNSSFELGDSLVITGSAKRKQNKSLIKHKSAG